MIGMDFVELDVSKSGNRCTSTNDFFTTFTGSGVILSGTITKG